MVRKRQPSGMDLVGAFFRISRIEVEVLKYLGRSTSATTELRRMIQFALQHRPDFDFDTFYAYLQDSVYPGVSAEMRASLERDLATLRDRVTTKVVESGVLPPLLSEEAATAFIEMRPEEAIVKRSDLLDAGSVRAFIDKRHEDAIMERSELLDAAGVGALLAEPKKESR